VALFLCESSGARVFLANQGITQQGTEYQASLSTWDVVPMGEVGDVYFRSIDVSVLVTNGYYIGITPIIDGVAQTEQLFNGSGSGERQLQAFISSRGTRIAATIRTISRAGSVEIHNVSCSFVPIRRVP
jgi:hypothetical protein